MNGDNGKRELDYQLIKLLLRNLVLAGLITPKEAEAIRKRAQEHYDPIIGSFD